METIGRSVAAPARNYPPLIISTALHVVVFAVMVYQARHFVAPIRYPGTASGHNLVLSYLPGRAPKPTVAPSPQAPPVEVKPKITLKQPEMAAASQVSPNLNSPASEHPDASSGADAFGEGNISIALAKYFPRPKPDLSNLPDGAKGDVVLDITIDETGKISDLKLVKGIDQGVDEFVIAAVRQWTFTPASRDGQPVASEQELHFHYEKG
jgi:periplasmic protein TonB